MPDNDRKRAEEIARKILKAWTPTEYSDAVDAITTFASEVRAEQRERDAKIVESFAHDIHMETTDGAEIAAAIRNEVEG